MIGDNPTGADLVTAIELAARSRGVSAAEFTAPLSTQPNSWLYQLRKARRPKPATVDRIRAIIEGRPVPPPAPPATIAQPILHRARIAPPQTNDPRPIAFDREPCSYCGVRGEVGCRHRRAYSVAAL